jgi:hypothetical protein
MLFTVENWRVVPYATGKIEVVPFVKKHDTLPEQV